MKEKEFQKFVKDNADVMPLFVKLTTKVLCNKGTDEENKLHEKIWTAITKGDYSPLNLLRNDKEVA